MQLIKSILRASSFRKAVSEDSFSLGFDADSLSSCVRLPIEQLCPLTHWAVVSADSLSSCVRLPIGAASYPRPGLATFNSQEGHIIHKDLPEGHTLV